MLKWVGGKSRTTKLFNQYLPKEFHNHYEPFVGGGWLYFSMASDTRQHLLSDINQDLISFYKIVRDDFDGFMNRLHQIEEEYDFTKKEDFLRIRKEFNETPDPVRFYVLIRTSFNGLVRFNQKGEFNSAWGERRLFYEEKELIFMNKNLQHASLECQSYDSMVGIQPGDLLVCDPPYAKQDQKEEVVYKNKKTIKGFNHIAFADWAKSHSDNGVKVMVFNYDTPFIRSLFDGWNFVEYKLGKTFSGAKELRKKSNEILLMNYME